MKEKPKRDTAFDSLFYPDKLKAFHTAITRGVENKCAGWTRDNVIDEIGKLLEACQLFGLDPIPHLRKFLPRFVWRSYNTDQESHFSYDTALGHTDVVFFLDPIVVTMKWQKRSHSRSNLLHLCWVGHGAESYVDIRKAITRCHSRQIKKGD